MLQRLMPLRADNEYHGHPLALWLLWPLVLLKGAIGVGTMVNGREAAVSADGIPLDTFGAAGEQAFVAVFAAWGLSHLVLALVGVAILLRYRSLAAFLFLVLLVENVARKVLFHYLPIARTAEAPGFWINAAFIIAMAAGLALALMNRSET